MRRPFQIALTLFGVIIGPRLAAAQAMPGIQPFHLGTSVRSSAPNQMDSARASRLATRRFVVTSRPAVECRMPVVVPDPATSERMPVARVNPAAHAIRQVPVGCVNPLVAAPDSARRATPVP